MRKKKHEEHVNHERWLVSYADFITLLFAFFVVMFAVSQVDSNKMGRFVESVNTAFEYQGPFPGATNTIVTGEGTSALTGSPGIGLGAGGASPSLVPSRRVSDLRAAIEKITRSTRLAGKVTVRQSSRGVVVSLSEAGFFDSGASEIRPDARDVVREIGETLREDDSPLAVEGHTDSTPIHTARFPSNWELSTARATSIVRYLIEDLHYAPSRLSAAGYGEYRPLGPNATAAGRALNRRVDIVILTKSSPGLPPA